MEHRADTSAEPRAAGASGEAPRRRDGTGERPEWRFSGRRGTPVKDRERPLDALPPKVQEAVLRLAREHGGELPDGGGARAPRRDLHLGDAAARPSTAPLPFPAPPPLAAIPDTAVHADPSLRAVAQRVPTPTPPPVSAAPMPVERRRPREDEHQRRPSPIPATGLASAPDERAVPHAIPPMPSLATPNATTADEIPNTGAVAPPAAADVPVDDPRRAKARAKVRQQRVRADVRERRREHAGDRGRGSRLRRLLHRSSDFSSASKAAPPPAPLEGHEKAFVRSPFGLDEGRAVAAGMPAPSAPGPSPDPDPGPDPVLTVDAVADTPAAAPSDVVPRHADEPDAAEHEPQIPTFAKPLDHELPPHGPPGYEPVAAVVKPVGVSVDALPRLLDIASPSAVPEFEAEIVDMPDPEPAPISLVAPEIEPTPALEPEPALEPAVALALEPEADAEPVVAALAWEPPHGVDMASLAVRELGLHPRFAAPASTPDRADQTETTPIRSDAPAHAAHAAQEPVAGSSQPTSPWEPVAAEQSAAATGEPVAIREPAAASWEPIAVEESPAAAWEPVAVEESLVPDEPATPERHEPERHEPAAVPAPRPAAQAPGRTAQAPPDDFADVRRRIAARRAQLDDIVADLARLGNG